MKSFTQFIVEDGMGGGAPTNSAGGGAIAGIGIPNPDKGDHFGEPGVDKKRKKKLKEGYNSDFSVKYRSFSAPLPSLEDVRRAVSAVPEQTTLAIGKDRAKCVALGYQKTPKGKGIQYDQKFSQMFANMLQKVYGYLTSEDPNDVFDRILDDDYGNFMEALMVAREIADDGDPKAIKDLEEMEDRLERAEKAREAARLKLVKAGKDLERAGKGINEDAEHFAGARVFEVDMDRFMKARHGKNRYHRYSRYVGEDDKGEEIRQHGRQTKDDIILKDSATQVMTYLRRKTPSGE